MHKKRESWGTTLNGEAVVFQIFLTIFSLVILGAFRNPKKHLEVYSFCLRFQGTHYISCVSVFLHFSFCFPYHFAASIRLTVAMWPTKVSYVYAVFWDSVTFCFSWGSKSLRSIVADMISAITLNNITSPTYLSWFLFF